MRREINRKESYDVAYYIKQLFDNNNNNNF